MTAKAMNPSSCTLEQSSTSLAVSDILSMEAYESSSTVMTNDHESEEVALIDLLRGLSTISSTVTLAQNGWVKKGFISDVLQGQIIEAVSIHDASKRAAIKIIEKERHFEKLCKTEDTKTSIMTEENIVKEAVLLKFCTVSNQSVGHSIARYIDFFQDDDYFYLVTEYCHDMNLKQFIEISHGYIQKRKLSLKMWRKIAKYILFQIAALLHWLHDDLRMAHLNLKTDNILLENVNFTEGADGSISISRNIRIKLTNFSLSEIFDGDNFECDKYDITHHDQYTSPQLFNNEIYDARKADIYAFGIIMFKMMYFSNPYRFQNIESDPEFSALCRGSFQCANKRMTSVFKMVFCFNENKRGSALDILHSKWLNEYWSKYESQIEHKSKQQKKELILQKTTPNTTYFLLPFYSL